jgi:hypothetical protein
MHFVCSHTQEAEQAFSLSAPPLGWLTFVKSLFIFMIEPAPSWIPWPWRLVDSGLDSIQFKINPKPRWLKKARKHETAVLI